MTDIEIIRAACVSANPEIVELKFGCEVTAFATDDVVVEQRGKIIGIQLEQPYDTLVYFAYDSCPFIRALKPYRENAEKTPRDYKIIGRPIHLTDVLWAIYARGPEMKTRVNLECDGQFLTWTPEVGHRLGPTWNLRNDDLSAQSEETLQFLANLLK